jgi:hypothetical protein
MLSDIYVHFEIQAQCTFNILKQMKSLVFFMAISIFLIASQNNLCHHLDFKKHPKNIPNNNVTFQRVEDDFNYEKKFINQKNYIRMFTTSIFRCLKKNQIFIKTFRLFSNT